MERNLRNRGRLKDTERKKDTTEIDVTDTEIDLTITEVDFTDTDRNRDIH